MVKARIFYDDQRELEEVIKLLSPRMIYYKTFPEETPKRALFGIDTSDLLTSESLSLPEESDLPEEKNEKGDQDND